MNIHTFLMFEGRAEEAVNLYVSQFPNSRIVDVQRHGEEGPGKPGISTLYRFELNGVEYRALDSSPDRWDFRKPELLDREFG